MMPTDDEDATTHTRNSKLFLFLPFSCFDFSSFSFGKQTKETYLCAYHECDGTRFVRSSKLCSFSVLSAVGWSLASDKRIQAKTMILKLLIRHVQCTMMLFTHFIQEILSL